MSNMNDYIDLYFIHFDPLFPIIHRLTLNIRTQHPILYLVMMTIGSAFSSDLNAYRTLLGLHRKLRKHLVDVMESDSTPNTPVLQALLLINHFGRMYGSARHYDFDQVSYSLEGGADFQIHHSAVITAAIHSGLLNINSTHWSQCKTLGAAGWTLWAEAEERIRLAWLAYVSESFNAAYYRYVLRTGIKLTSVGLPW